MLRFSRKCLASLRILTHLQFSRQTVLKSSVKLNANRYCGDRIVREEGQADRGTDGEAEKYDKGIHKFVSNPKVISKHSKYKQST